MRKIAASCPVLVLCAFTLASSAFGDAPERAQHAAFGISSQAVGTDYGFGLSVVTPYFGDENQFAIRAAWDYMEFANGTGGGDGTFNNSTYNKFNLDLVWTTWLTERLRGFWRIGAGVIPGVSDVGTRVAIAGDSAFGLEYFPKTFSWVSFVANLGGIVAEEIRTNDSTSYSSARAPYGSGVAAEVGFHFYFF